MGQSAGGMLVSTIQLILAGKEWRGKPFLFDRAIIMSGSSLTLKPKTLQDLHGQPKFAMIARDMGCSPQSSADGNKIDVLECLRAVDAAKITDYCERKGWEFSWLPTIDGHLITDTFVNLIAAGQVMPIPTFLTSCRHDGSLFTYFESFDKGIQDQERVTRILFGEDKELVKKVVKAYDLPRYGGSAYMATTAAATDAIFKCPLLEYAAAIQPHVPALYYLNLHRSLWVTTVMRRFGIMRDVGAFHGSDIIFLFNPITMLAIGHAKSIRHLRAQFLKFAITGNPVVNSKAAAKLNAAIEQEKWGKKESYDKVAIVIDKNTECPEKQQQQALKTRPSPSSTVAAGRDLTGIDDVEAYGNDMEIRADAVTFDQNNSSFIDDGQFSGQEKRLLPYRNRSHPTSISGTENGERIGPGGIVLSSPEAETRWSLDACAPNSARDVIKKSHEPVRLIKAVLLDSRCMFWRNVEIDKFIMTGSKVDIFPDPLPSSMPSPIDNVEEGNDRLF